MESKEKTVITVEATIDAPVSHVWKCWTSPEDIIHWNSASEDWHTLRAENDLRVGGKFVARMEAKDGSMGFNFEGIYETVRINEKIVYRIADGRTVNIEFVDLGKQSKVIESFEAEDVNSVELQRGGWQAIMDNFKKYAEAKAK